MDIESLRGISDVILNEMIEKGAGGFAGDHRKMLLHEKQRRLAEKEERYTKEQQEIKRDQKQIKHMTVIVLLLTAASLVVSILQFLQSRAATM